jgi:hypothetical protein
MITIVNIINTLILIIFTNILLHYLFKNINKNSFNFFRRPGIQKYLTNYKLIFIFCFIILNFIYIDYIVTEFENNYIIISYNALITTSSSAPSPTPHPKPKPRPKPMFPIPFPLPTLPKPIVLVFLLLLITNIFNKKKIFSFFSSMTIAMIPFTSLS